VSELNRRNRRFPFFGFDDDIFKIGFGEDIERIWNDIDSKFQRMRDDPEFKSGKPMYYGYSVSVGPDGVPHVREYGNVKTDKEEKKIITESENACGCPSVPAVESAPVQDTSEDVIEPYVCSMFDDKTKELKVTAEVPGISKEDIDLELKDDKLILTAKNDKKNYRKDLKVDQEISKKSIKANYNNGVLEITMKCKRPTSKPKKGKKIDVE
jgi:HSP20 family protein